MADQPQMVAPGVYGLVGGVVNQYLLDGGESGLAVIDAGMPGSARKMLALIEQIGRQPQDVKRILVTHADIDHAGGLKALAAATGAAVYASAESEQFIRRRRNPPHAALPMALISAAISLFIRRAANVDHRVSDGDVLPIAGGLRVIATPGHTQDHVSYYWERERVLFAGDLFNTRKGLALTPRAISWDMAAAQRSARAVIALNPAVICVGHGPVWRADQDPDRLAALLASLPETP